MSRCVLITSSVCVAASLVACSGFGTNSPTSKKAEDSATSKKAEESKLNEAAAISPGRALFNDYLANEADADAKYLGKTIEIRVNTIEGVKKDSSGRYYMVDGSGGFLFRFNEKADRLGKIQKGGPMVLLVGVCEGKRESSGGFGFQILFTECKVKHFLVFNEKTGTYDNAD
jgi:hypothetical protein